MKNFDQTLQQIIQEFSPSMSNAPLNSMQLSKDFERIAATMTPASKKALQAIAEPLEKATDENTDDDLINRLKEMDFDNMSTDKKEEFIKTLLSKNIQVQKNDQSTDTSTDTQANTNTNSTSPTDYKV
jgi:hypothetical protein